MKRIDLTKRLSPYAKKKLWVALSPENYKVVGAGKDPEKALNEAKKRKIKSPILLQALLDYSGFIPSAKNEI